MNRSSADKIHFFLEKDATESTDKSVAINKVGHGLHVQDELFKAYSESKKVFIKCIA